ncbi:SsgA family sporulation/cell division regulator [Bailinhaonella thermotolerans]|uniref:SsgA family sporulation/cell division regulator n=2 Tax=Bailinhaonella thermotolerans TaxID=1070861 RepID=A0A3A4A0G2_9ACTN|nr:SsgA family sporulation/cell division regulator [Bailinhaonella thermotolerans]
MPLLTAMPAWPVDDSGEDATLVMAWDVAQPAEVRLVLVNARGLARDWSVARHVLADVLDPDVAGPAGLDLVRAAISLIDDREWLRLELRRQDEREPVTVLVTADRVRLWLHETYDLLSQDAEQQAVGRAAERAMHALLSGGECA